MEDNSASTTEISETQTKPFHEQQSCSPPLSSDPDQKSPVTETHTPLAQHDDGFQDSNDVIRRPGSNASSRRNSQSLLRASNASTNPRSPHLSSEFSEQEGGGGRYKLPTQEKARDSMRGKRRRASSGSQANSLKKQDVVLVYHAPEYRHKVNILGEPSRYTLDKSKKMTVDHEENVKSPRLKSLATGIQVKPDIELDKQRKTMLDITLTLGSPHQDYLYFAETEAILWDYRDLRELGKTRQRNDFNSEYNQKTFSMTLADRERVERYNSKHLEVIVRVTLCGYPRGQLTEEVEEVNTLQNSLTDS